MIKNSLQFLGLYMTFDLMGFLLWAVSGQCPDWSGWWLGKITYTIIKIII